MSPSPAALAPAFVVLLGCCSAIFSDFAGAAPPASLFIAAATAAAWMLAGSERFVPRWAPTFILILVITVAFSAVNLYRLNRVTEIPSQFAAEAKVLLNRQWGKSRALLISSPYGRLVVYMPPLQAPPAGATIWIRGAVFDFNGAVEGGFDESLFWQARGAAKKLIPLDCRIISEPQGVYLWRDLIARRIVQTLPERTAGYLLAFFLGVKTEELTELHQYAGTLHLLAVSGFHVAVMAWLAQLLFRRGMLKLFGVSAVVWGYVLLAGASPGGVRAALMLQIYLLSLLLGRPSSAFNGVSLAGVLLLIYNPWNFFDIGWRLSMLAALFLSALGGVMERTWKTGVIASTLVWLVTAPQALIAFREIPIGGLLINPIAVTLFAFIFPLILLLALPSLAGLACGGHTASIAEFILVVWEIFSRTVAGSLPWGIGYTDPLFALAVFVFSAAALGASGFSKVKIAAGSFLLPAILLLLT